MLTERENAFKGKIKILMLMKGLKDSDKPQDLDQSLFADVVRESCLRNKLLKLTWIASKKSSMKRNQGCFHNVLMYTARQTIQNGFLSLQM